MKKSRIIALFLALAAAAGAFVLSSGQRAPTPEPKVADAPAAPTPTDDVLVAAKDIPLGTIVNEAEMQWQSWPKDAVPIGMIKKSENPTVVAELKGSIARASLIQGEPVRREKLIKSSNAGFMAAILPPGMRAVAINIDSQGATTAGGFILPNDRVDVVRTSRETGKAQGDDSYVSETLLQNVRVLAIGQNVQDKNGQPVVVGSNATLELDPAQAETVILAQRTGQLSLTLRSMQDIRQNAKASQVQKGMTIVRYGTASEDSGR